jgi:hypothetical protein
MNVISWDYIFYIRVVFVLKECDDMNDITTAACRHFCQETFIGISQEDEEDRNRLEMKTNGREIETKEKGRMKNIIETNERKTEMKGKDRMKSLIESTEKEIEMKEKDRIKNKMAENEKEIKIKEKDRIRYEMAKNEREIEMKEKDRMKNEEKDVSLKSNWIVRLPTLNLKTDRVNSV